MDRKDDGYFGGNGVDGAQQLAELVRRINIRGAMEGQNAEAMPAGSILQSKLITDCRLLGDGKKVAQGIGQDTVDLLGHSTVKAAEPRLDVGNADAEFGGGQ